METIYLIRGSIGKFIKSFDMVIKALLKILAYYLLFRYVSNMEGIVGSGLLNSLPAHLILAVVSMLLPNRCGILLAILLGLYNISQITMLGAVVAGVFFLVLYIMTSRLFPDHVYMLALVPLILHFRMYLLLPLFAGMYLGVVALIPMICGAVMAIMLTLIPEFLNLQMPANLDELPQILSDIFKYGFNQILHNEELVFIAIIFTGVVILVHLLHKMEINYGDYIALVAGTVLGLVCLFMGKMTFGISDSYISVILYSILALLVMAVVEFMHSALNYQSTQKLSFEDDEYQYYVTVIPKIAVSKPKREVKNITEEPTRSSESSGMSQTGRVPNVEYGQEKRPIDTSTVTYQPVDTPPHKPKDTAGKRHELPGVQENVQIEKPAAGKAAATEVKPAAKKVSEKAESPAVKSEGSPVREASAKVQGKKTNTKEETLNSFFEED